MGHMGHVAHLANCYHANMKVGNSNPSSYRILIGGQLDQSWSAWFDNLRIQTSENETALEGHISDQAALFGILNKVRNLGLPLLAVIPIHTETETN